MKKNITTYLILKRKWRILRILSIQNVKAKKKIDILLEL